MWYIDKSVIFLIAKGGRAGPRARGGIGRSDTNRIDKTGNVGREATRVPWGMTSMRAKQADRRFGHSESVESGRRIARRRDESCDA
jgi:hypothetical protein